VEIERPWKARHFFGDPEDLQAAGAVIAAWNFVEESFAQLMWRVLRIDWQNAMRAFEMLNAQSRLDLLKLEGERILGKEEYELVKKFIEYFKILQDNRNLVVHAKFSKNSVDGGINLSKVSKGDRLTRNTFVISQKEMLSLADSMYDLAQFGFRLSMAIWAGPTRTLMAGDQKVAASLLELFERPITLKPSLQSD